MEEHQIVVVFDVSALPPTDDTWSGRGNDGRQSYLDGYREGMLDVLRAATLLKEDTEVNPRDDGAERINCEHAASVLLDIVEEWGADPDAVGDTPADFRNFLRERAYNLKGRSASKAPRNC